MVFNKLRFEKYAMRAETIDKTAKIEALGVNIDRLSHDLNIDKEEGRSLARYMNKIGWAELLIKPPLPPTLVLTPKGYEEIAKLNRPTWQRWVDAHPKIVTIFLGVLAAAVTSIIAEALKRLLWTATQS